jgi:hypothetical protein
MPPALAAGADPEVEVEAGEVDAAELGAALACEDVAAGLDADASGAELLAAETGVSLADGTIGTSV